MSYHTRATTTKHTTHLTTLYIIPFHHHMNTHDPVLSKLSKKVDACVKLKRHLLLRDTPYHTLPVCSGYAAGIAMKLYSTPQTKAVAGLGFVVLPLLSSVTTLNMNGGRDRVRPRHTTHRIRNAPSASCMILHCCTCATFDVCNVHGCLQLPVKKMKLKGGQLLDGPSPMQHLPERGGGAPGGRRVLSLTPLRCAGGITRIRSYNL